MPATNNVLGLFEQQIFIFLLVIILAHGSPQNGHINETPGSALVAGLNIPSPTEDGKQYGFTNGIYMIQTHPGFRMALNPKILVQGTPSGVSYYRAVGTTSSPISEAINRSGFTKETPQVSTPDSRVVFKDRPTTPTSNINTRFGQNDSNIKYVPHEDDKNRCKNDPLKCNATSSNYPRNIIEGLFSENKISEELFTKDNPPDEIQTRFDSEKAFCSSTQHLIFPEVGINRDNKSRFIIQLPDKNLTQGILIETCVIKDSTSECHNLKTKISYESTECVQKRAYRNLISLDPSGRKILQESIEIPSCCVCMYRDRK